MAKKNKDSEYYSYLLINKTKRAGFYIIFIVIYGFTIFTITQLVNAPHQSWIYAGIPIIFLGIPLMFYPPIEEWVYKPWQSKPQKYERHYRDKV